MKDCCQKGESKGYGGNKGKKGIFLGIVYGILPHSFCIAFILFSVLGATAATTLFKKALLTPYFFQVLVGFSLVFAALSATLYLKKGRKFSLTVIREKWRYLLVLFGSTIAVNLVFFLVIFPLTVNIGGKQVLGLANNAEEVVLKVDIPCSGHAPLIVDEVRNLKGVRAVRFEFPANFVINFDPKQTSQTEILSLKIFKTFKAKIII